MAAMRKIVKKRVGSDGKEIDCQQDDARFRGLVHRKRHQR